MFLLDGGSDRRFKQMRWTVRRFALVALVAIQSCAVSVTCLSLCGAQEKATDAFAEDKLPEEVAKYLREGVHVWGIDASGLRRGGIHAPAKVGELGQFALTSRKYQMSVAQVFKNKILVNFDWGSMAGDRFRPDRTGSFLVKGIDTKGLVSDAKWTPAPDDIFEVVDTETYETVAGGTKTVLVLSPVRTDRIKAYMEAKAAETRAREEKAQAEVQKAREAEEQRKANAEKARWHTWSDSDGTSQFEARVIGINNGNVVLKKRDNTITRIPLEKLSADDQEWLEQWKKPHTKDQ